MRYTIQDTILTGIANAIRKKTGKVSPIVPENMANEIESISGGGGSTPFDFETDCTWETLFTGDSAVASIPLSKSIQGFDFIKIKTAHGTGYTTTFTTIVPIECIAYCRLNKILDII